LAPPYLQGTIDLVVVDKQWWRLLSSIFLTAGLLQLSWCLSVMWTYGRHLERSTSFFAVALVYVASGFAGMLVSANMLPGAVTVGASAAVCGLLGAQWTVCVADWQYYRRHLLSVLTLLITTASAAAIGFLPFVDNWAHLGGLWMGIMAGILLLSADDPVTFRRSKLMLSSQFLALCAVIAAFTALVLALVLDLRIVAGCGWCHQISCLPSPTFNCSNATAYPERQQGWLMRYGSLRPKSTPASNNPTSCCEDLPAFKAESGADDRVCAASLWPGQTCMWSVTFSYAQQSCNAAGARLCTLAELRAGEAAGTGCNHDGELVWSSDPCVEMGTQGWAALQGNGAGGLRCLLGTSGARGELAGRAAMRCCADACTAADLSPYAWTSTATSSGQAPPQEEPGRCCTDLQARYGFVKEAGLDTPFCSASTWPGQPCTPVSHSRAEANCQAVGARLCSLRELYDKSPRTTLCGRQHEAWTSDPCIILGRPGHMTARSRDGQFPKCVLDDERSAASTTCCGDPCPEPPPPPPPAPQFPQQQACCDTLVPGLGFQSAQGVTDRICSAASWEGQSCLTYTSFGYAESSCSAVGARLCSLRELSAGVAQGLAGCKLDASYVWSSDYCFTAAGALGRVVALAASGSNAYCKPEFSFAGAAMVCCADACKDPSSTPATGRSGSSGSRWLL